jgi:hypothetical protein
MEEKVTALARRGRLPSAIRILTGEERANVNNAATLAATVGERRKLKEQADLPRHAFVPLAFEATGGHTTLVEQVMHYILEQKQIMTGVPFAESTTRLWQLISIAIARHNAQAIAGCMGRDYEDAL